MSAIQCEKQKTFHFLRRHAAAAAANAAAADEKSRVGWRVRMRDGLKGGMKNRKWRIRDGVGVGWCGVRWREKLDGDKGRNWAGAMKLWYEYSEFPL